MADANIFEFDVVPYGNFISLDYVFASEEWPQNTCDSGADVMAIMISGPGISGQKNIALLPNSNTPVTTHTVYPPNTGCFEQGGSPYYIDNTNCENVIYNGFTKVLRAASIVQPCQTYHIKVMVAEGARHPYEPYGYILKTGNPNEIDTAKSDTFLSWVSGLEFYDSGVFLKMGSLKSMDTVTIQALGGLSQSAAYPYAMKGCFNAKFRLTTTDSLPIPRTYTLQYGGTAISGVDYQALPLTVTVPAFEKSVEIPVNILPQSQGDKLLVVKVKSPYGTCGPAYNEFLSSATLQIVTQYPVGASPQDTTICSGCSVQLLAQTEPGVNYSYSWSPNQTLSNATIANPIASPQTETTYTLTATAYTSWQNCATGTAVAKVKIGGVSVKEAEENSLNLKIFPNPAKENLFVTAEPGIILKSYEVIDLNGRKISSGTFSLNHEASINTSALSAGVYTLKITSNKGDCKVKFGKE
ncbi:MAG TPA: choice-of-anchor L domain-containing protein [Edaphocola sp.]|nr:choice-of-anchor L domain-containing protein [Edaphocola sp.]